MSVTDKGDGLSKEGTGRVALYKESKLNLCYTIECNYNSGNITNNIVTRSNGTYGKIKLQIIKFIFKYCISIRYESKCKRS